MFFVYLGMLLFCPLFFVAASSFTLYVTTAVEAASEQLFVADVVNPLMALVTELTPFFLWWVLFTAVFVVMPNTRVKIWPCVLTGMITGGVFQFIQKLYFHSQMVLYSYGVIYGSFAAFPLFLFWLDISWLLVFAGAELTYQISAGPEVWVKGPQKKGAKPMVTRQEVGLLTADHLLAAYEAGRPLPTEAELAGAVGVSAASLEPVIRALEEGGRD